MNETQAGFFVFTLVGLIVMGGGIKSLVTGQFNMGRSHALTKENGNSYWLVTAFIFAIGVFFVWQGLRGIFS